MEVILKGNFEGYCIISKLNNIEYCWDFFQNAWKPFPYNFDQHCVGMKWQAINKQKELCEGEVKKVSVNYTIS